MSQEWKEMKKRWKQDLVSSAGSFVRKKTWEDALLNPRLLFWDGSCQPYLAAFNSLLLHTSSCTHWLWGDILNNMMIHSLEDTESTICSSAQLSCIQSLLHLLSSCSKSSSSLVQLRSKNNIFIWSKQCSTSSCSFSITVSFIWLVAEPIISQDLFWRMNTSQKTFSGRRD